MASKGSASSAARLVMPRCGQVGVAHAVEPLSGAVQRLADGVRLPAHADPLHEPPGGFVLGEAVGDDAAQAELLERQAQQLAYRLGRIAVARVSRIEDPPEPGLDPESAFGDVPLR